MFREAKKEDLSKIAYYMKKMEDMPYGENEYNAHPFTHFLFLEEEEIIGFLCYTKIYERFEIEYIYIEEKYRKKGYAHKMMNYIIAEARKKQAENITLEVSVENQKALTLYQKCGFEIVAVRKGYYKGIDGYLMLRKL